MTPAETPTECEACADLKATAQFSAARHSRDLHARIRELEGTLRFIATEWDLKPTIKELRSRAKAALARPEGGSK